MADLIPAHHQPALSHDRLILGDAPDEDDPKANEIEDA